MEIKQTLEVNNLLKQARVLRDMGRTCESLPLLERALAAAPFDANLLCHLSVAYLDMEEWEKSLAATDKALSANPTCGWAYRLRGSSLCALGRRAEALESAHNAAQYSPNAPLVLFHLGETLRLCGDYKAAEETGKRLLQIAPEEVRGHLLLTAVYTSIQRWPAVEGHARAGLQINAENAMLYRRLGKALFQQERYGEAVEAYLHSLQIEPTDQQTQQQFRQACLKVSLSPFSHVCIGVSLAGMFWYVSSWKIGIAAALCITCVLALLTGAMVTTLPPSLTLWLQPAYRRLPVAARRQITEQCRNGWAKTDFALVGIVMASLLMLILALLLTHP